jgi:TM2 domain-containing membrane protein YozV
MARFKLEGPQIGILAIVILLIIIGLIVVIIPSGSSPPSDTSTDQPTDHPIDQPTGDSVNGLDAIIMIVVALIPVFIVILIIQFAIKHIMRSDWEDTEKKGLISRISRSLTRSKCHGTYDAANKKCSSCDESEQCKKETADAVKKIKKGWFHE